MFMREPTGRPAGRPSQWGQGHRAPDTTPEQLTNTYLVHGEPAPVWYPRISMSVYSPVLQPDPAIAVTASDGRAKE